MFTSHWPCFTAFTVSARHVLYFAIFCYGAIVLHATLTGNVPPIVLVNGFSGAKMYTSYYGKWFPHSMRCDPNMDLHFTWADPVNLYKRGACDLWAMDVAYDEESGNFSTQDDVMLRIHPWGRSHSDARPLICLIGDYRPVLCDLPGKKNDKGYFVYLYDWLKKEYHYDDTRRPGAAFDWRLEADNGTFFVYFWKHHGPRNPKRL